MYSVCIADMHNPATTRGYIFMKQLKLQKKEVGHDRGKPTYVWTEITICCHLATKTAEDSRGHMLWNS